MHNEPMSGERSRLRSVGVVLAWASWAGIALAANGCNSKSSAPPGLESSAPSTRTSASVTAGEVAEASTPPPAASSPPPAPGSFRVVYVGETPDAQEHRALVKFEAAVRNAVGPGAEFATGDAAEEAYATAAWADADSPDAPLPDAWRSRETVVVLRVVTWARPSEGVTVRGFGDLVVVRPSLGGVTYRETSHGWEFPLLGSGARDYASRLVRLGGST